MRIRVTTKAALYERRKQEYIHRGYRIEEERPTAVNGFCTFVAASDSSSNPIDELVAQAIEGNHSGRRDW